MEFLLLQRYDSCIMQGKLWTISNLLSLSRIILMIPAAYFLVTPLQFHREIAVLIILVAVLTDALDGYFARKLNQISEVGKIIDPLADKIGVGIVVVLLTVSGDIPLWFAVVVLMRDIIIFFAGLFLKAKTNIILPSTMSGKIAVSFLAFYLVFAILQYPVMNTIAQYLLWVCIALLAYSITVYTKRFFFTLQEFNKGK